MISIERIPFLPHTADVFSALFTRPLANARNISGDNPALMLAVFKLEAAQNEIILYTDGHSLRLVGIFPPFGDAYFGCWETTHDRLLNQRAFALLEADARQRGRLLLRGPLNVNTFHAYRLRLGEPPSWGHFDREPANPPFYPALLEQLGFGVCERFESRLLAKANIPQAYSNKLLLLAGLAQLPVDIIPLNPGIWAQHEAELFALVQQVFRDNPAYRPISKAQFELRYNQQFAGKLCPYSSVLFRDKALGQLVALSFCYPDYQSLALAPGDLPNFQRDYSRLTKKVLLVKTVGVHPDFRKRGLMSFLGAYGMVHFRELYDDVIFCLMRADNFSRHFSDGLPCETARYALFGKELGAV